MPIKIHEFNGHADVLQILFGVGDIIVGAGFTSGESKKHGCLSFWQDVPGEIGRDQVEYNGPAKDAPKPDLVIRFPDKESVEFMIDQLRLIKEKFDG